MSPAEVIARCAAKDPRYAGVSATGVKVVPAAAADAPPCPHLGEPTGETVGCRTCGSGRGRAEVYACSKYGLTVIGNRAPASDKVTACRWCPDRPRPVAATPARAAVPAKPPRAALPPFADRVAWVSTARLAKDTAALAGLVPPDCSGVVGVPRSGMLPASMLATQLHLPLGEVLKSGGVRWLGSGNRGGPGLLTQRGPVLVVDDTVYGGSAMRRTRSALAGVDALYAAVYARPEAASAVDLYARPLPAPHLLEWNFANNGPLCGFAADRSYGTGIATDLDGILCHDEYSGGVPGTPYLTPRLHPVRLIVTGRAERHRRATEADLRRWRVRWERLEMLPDDVPLTAESAAAHKARHYAASGHGYFMESCPEQARLIHAATGKPVVCPVLDKVLHR